MEQYQDIGDKKGVRDCAGRYALVREQLGRFKRPFTMLDIGANAGYFTLNAAGEFPNSMFVAVEKDGHYCDDFIHAMGKRMPNVVLLWHEMTQDDLKELSRCEFFDITLALSVVHHFKGIINRQYLLDDLSFLGSLLVLETPVEPSIGGPWPAEGFTRIGEFPSHVEPGMMRPMSVGHWFHWHRISRAYLGSNYDIKCMVESDVDKISFHHEEKGQSWPFIAGINLWTFLKLGGIYPKREDLVARVEAMDLSEHHDVAPWNFLITPIGLVAIDGDDKRTGVLDWREGKKKTIEAILHGA